MKRFAVSLLGGFVLPFLYTIIVGPLTPYLKDNRTLNVLAMIPVRWPIMILYKLEVFPFESESSLFLYILVCNVLLYASLTYFILFSLSRSKRRIQLPPGPPEFK